MRVSRQWRDLQTRKRFGWGHSFEGAPGLGDLALFCPACPQPGINLPEGWESDPDQLVEIKLECFFIEVMIRQVALSAKHCRRWELFCRTP
jgi:hypothetical protein